MAKTLIEVLPEHKPFDCKRCKNKWLAKETPTCCPVCERGDWDSDNEPGGDFDHSSESITAVY